MASLTGQTVSSTYDGLLKTEDNDILGASGKLITDGLGNSSGLTLSTTGDVSISGDLTVDGAILDSNGYAGDNGQILSSTGAGTDWIDLSEISGVDGSGTANYVPKWTDGDTIGNSVIYDDGTNVGIGTASPAAALHIVKSGGNNGIRIITDNTFNGFVHFGDTEDDNIGRIVYSHSENAMQFVTSDAERMRIDSSGRVGIGTTSPATPLHVETSGNSVALFKSTTANSNIVFRDGTATADVTVGSVDNGQFRIQVNNNERLRIDSSGRVGIGTTSPAYPLHISSTFGLPILIERTNSRNAGIRFKDNQTTSVDSVNIKADINDFVITTGGNEAMRIDSSGNVGIGTSSPNGRTEIVSSATGDTLALQLSNSAGAGNDSVSIRFRNSTVSTSTSGGSEITGLRDATNNGGSLILKTSSSVGALTERMRIDSSGDIKFTSTQGTTLQFERVDSTTVGADVLGKLDFKSTDANDSNVNASIKVVKDDVAVGTVPMAITFETGVGGVKSERMRIDSSGDVSINQGLLELGGEGISAGYLISEEGLFFNTDVNNNSDGQIVFGQGRRRNTGGTEYMRIDSSGNVGIGLIPNVRFNIYGAGDGTDTVMKIQNSTYSSTNTSGENKLQFGWSNHSGAAISAYKDGTVNRTGFKIYAEVGFNVPVEVMRITSYGDLHVDGDVIAYSTTISDQRLKDDVQTIDNALDKVSNLRGVSYTWNNGNRKGQKDLGLIAQEVEQVLPELVREKEMPMIDGETYKTVDYEKIVGVLIEAVKELKTEIEILKAK